jgi:tRNA modification GTPase
MYARAVRPAPTYLPAMSGALDDTIAAISTAPGRAGTALVRVSGPAAERIARALGCPELPARVARIAGVRHPDGRELDRALVTRFPAPSSYTGEDVVEISCHGGGLVPALVLDAACAAGARRAEAGEFTRRAYLNGKLDLVQVEATQDLIEATSPAVHRAALFQLEGGLSRRIEALRGAAIELRALLAYEIDFPEEDDGPVPRQRIEAAAEDLRAGVADLLENAPEGERLRDGVLVVLAGAPNAGKSSVFNSLLGSQRAIVTAAPGTTRDAIEAGTTIEGFPFRLVDTAGVREGGEEAERIGIEVARRYLGHADIVLLCKEAEGSLDRAERELVRETESRGCDVLLLRTKRDLRENPIEGPVGSDHSGLEELSVSARTGEGMRRLRARLAERSFAGLRASSEPALVTRTRHVRCLERADDEIGAFLEALAAARPPEIAETHLVDATLALEEIIGVTDVEDVLEAIFASFCVGK